MSFVFSFSINNKVINNKEFLTRYLHVTTLKYMTMVFLSSFIISILNNKYFLV